MIRRGDFDTLEYNIKNWKLSWVVFWGIRKLEILNGF
jgi:hypothetical protein